MAIRENLGFIKSSIKIIEKINHPNLFLSIQVIEGSGFEDKDLDFLIPENFTEASSVPKTIIYIDQKKMAPKIVIILRYMLPAAIRIKPPRLIVWNGDPRSAAEILIPTYHASLSDSMKAYIEQDWKAGRARIMVASSAWDLGIDDSDVERVIQWRVKHLANLDTVIQRFGRADRDKSIQGACLLFTEARFIGIRSVTTKPTKRGASEPKKKRTPDELRRDMEDGLYKFLNTPGSIKYRRKVILGYYGDEK
ncbi:hypothetical protein EV426DRAFT_540983 [Tirmania nivea]|nr:hypothetical protein EV426DRAFT_540983 [Tirmania nivea]